MHFRVIVALTASALLATAAAGCSAADHSRSSVVATSRSNASRVTLSEFTLRSDGITFFMHPTDAPILVSSTAGAPLKVCEVGTTFSTYWRGSCRWLLTTALALPSSGGAMHVGFRIRPATDRSIRVRRLRVRWHCVDHFYVLQRSGTAVPRALPSFDC